NGRYGDGDGQSGYGYGDGQSGHAYGDGQNQSMRNFLGGNDESARLAGTQYAPPPQAPAAHQERFGPEAENHGGMGLFSDNGRNEAGGHGQGGPQHEQGGPLPQEHFSPQDGYGYQAPPSAHMESFGDGQSSRGP